MILDEKLTVLLVEPDYYTQYPPLGLMKISSFYKDKGADVYFVRGLVKITIIPDIIEITSLFTYSRDKVHKAIEYYHNLFPNTTINVGGIYASLLPKSVKKDHNYVNVQVGLNPNAEKYQPDYSILEQVDKWKNWDGSILFTSRGCVNNCPFCMVPKLEGPMRSITDKPSELINPNHSRVIIWDNNFLALPNWYEKLEDLKKTNLWIDFNQGLDARLITDEKAKMLSTLKIKDYRMAYDGDNEKKAVHKAVELLSSYGINRRKMSFYTLYNFADEKVSRHDTPETFYLRVLDILELGCVSYPMRFVPLDANNKNSFISPYWNAEQLEMVARARRVLGFGGAFPPYNALINKFRNAGNFEEAFKLNPIKKE